MNTTYHSDCSSSSVGSVMGESSNSNSNSNSNTDGHRYVRNIPGFGDLPPTPICLTGVAHEDFRASQVRERALTRSPVGGRPRPMRQQRAAGSSASSGCTPPLPDVKAAVTDEAVKTTPPRDPLGIKEQHLIVLRMRKDSGVEASRITPASSRTPLRNAVADSHTRTQPTEAACGFCPVM